MYRYAIKANFRTTCSQVSQPASAGNVADAVNCKQAYHCMTPEQWTWLLRSVSVISAKKAVIARIKSINLPTSGFLEIFRS